MFYFYILIVFFIKVMIFLEFSIEIIVDIFYFYKDSRKLIIELSFYICYFWKVFKTGSLTIFILFVEVF